MQMQVHKRPVGKKEILKKEKYIEQMFNFYLSFACGYRAPMLHFFILDFDIYLAYIDWRKSEYSLCGMCGAISFSNFTLVHLSKLYNLNI